MAWPEEPCARPPLRDAAAGKTGVDVGSLARMLTTDANLLYIDMGGQPPAEFRDMVELIGSDVAPQLRDVAFTAAGR